MNPSQTKDDHKQLDIPDQRLAYLIDLAKTKQLVAYAPAKSLLPNPLKYTPYPGPSP